MSLSTGPDKNRIWQVVRELLRRELIPTFLRKNTLPPESVKADATTGTILTTRDSDTAQGTESAWVAPVDAGLATNPMTENLDMGANRVANMADPVDPEDAVPLSMLTTEVDQLTAYIDAHKDDATDAHDASAISADSTTLVGTGTNVQAVLEELDNGIADHLADTSAAHAASAVSNTPAGSIAATDVQAAINELDQTITDLNVSQYIPYAIANNKGDILAATADDTITRLAVGATKHMALLVDSAQATGLLWGDRTGIKVGTFAIPGATGDLAVTGVGFKPKGVLFFHSGDTNATVGRFGIGAMDASGNQFALSLADGATGPRYFSASNCIASLQTNADATADALATFVSMDTDGFTINFSARHTGQSVGWVAIG